MPDILQSLLVRAAPEKVFAAISSSEGLNSWWTETCSPVIEPGAEIILGFGPEFQWRAVVEELDAGRAFVIRMTAADDDWTGTRVEFIVEPEGDGSRVRFRHSGWRSENDHFRFSNHCWALYLRLMRRYAEHGEVVAYEDRQTA